ncbi:hypothetical protein IE81DRAFT_37527 [Ceraceosorus guamensis]|uniref:CAP-Gly domain-containing protein n=1 Tax=Ceraceosorus guamensis TaxID=1522189 RepID=A0A316W911_9BASI|nr:hypothetical protein IE81DRAFT_37527 [Ceraceosorus guamensis]PWN44195.1 hypothetical protein IE81DRAFT_37527 [Ceraceosorus guamensis]
MSAGGSAPVLRLQDRCEFTGYGRGTVLFVGQTSFAPGLWVGAHLDEPRGKNDGTVQGKRYFESFPGHGLFARISQARLLRPEEDSGHDEHEEADQDYEGPRDEPMDEEELMPPPSRPAPRTSRVPSPVKRPTASRQTTTTSVTPSGAARPRSSLAPSKLVSPQKAGTVGRSAIGASASRGSSPTKRAGVAATRTVQSAAVTRNTTPVASAATARMQRTSTAPGSVASGAASRVAGVTPRAVKPGSTIPGRAPDTATAKAGLRPVPKHRQSMAPPSARENAATTPRATTRTPTAAATSRSTSAASSVDVANRTPGARLAGRTGITPRVTAGSAAPGSARLAPPSTAPSARQPPPQARLSAASRRTAISTDDADEDNEEELMNMSLDAESLPGAEGLLSDEEGVEDSGELSPSVRKASLSGSRPRIDHMSLSSGPRPSAAEVGALQREIDELRARNRILEKRKEEDRERIREMERVKSDADGFLAAKPKLMAKQQELQNEIRDLYKLEKDWEAQKEELDRQVVELTDSTEMAVLDKEMAEERSESLKFELDAAQERIEELTSEVEILTAEKELRDAETEGGHDSSRQALGDESVQDAKRLPGYVQLERQNDRLRDALGRLRDITNETESEQKRRIAELEKELNSLSDLQAQFETVSQRLEAADAIIEDLKLQLDDALSTEEMLEQLTERNLLLGEKIEEMHATIEDLEAIKELNDELEETHIDTERQLQEEVDLKDLHVRDLRVRNEMLEASLVDHENTFAQFRELVLNLQGDLDTLRAEQAEQQSAAIAEDGTLVSDGAGGRTLQTQSQAMLNLNLKLQSSALKSQAKTIELELGKLEATQAMSHLDMIRPYLPAAYFEADADAVASLLFFNRMAHKAELIKTIVEGHHDIAGALATVVPEHLIGVCEMRHSLAHFAALSRQIAGVLQLASVPTFLKAGRTYREHASIERRIDSFIEALRHEELKEAECGREFARYVKDFEEFSYTLGEETDADLAAKEVGAAQLIDLDLDTLNAALGYTKQTLAALYNEGDHVGWELGGKSLDEDVFAPLQQLINNVKSTKVPARKLLRRLGSLYANDEAVRIEAITALPSTGLLSSQLVRFAKELAQSTTAQVAEVRAARTPFVMSNFVSAFNDALREGLAKSDVNLWATPLASTEHLTSTISLLLSAATEQENVTKVSGSLPWMTRVEEIKAEAELHHDAEAERALAKLQEDLKDMSRQLKTRESALEEATIKVERTTKQNEKYKTKLEDVAAIQSSLVEAQRQSRVYQEMNASLQSELETAERANDILKQQHSSKAVAGGPGGASAASGAFAGTGADSAEKTAQSNVPSGFMSGASATFETAYLADQVEALRGALAILRTENCRLKGAGLLQQFEALPRVYAPSASLLDDARTVEKEKPWKTPGLPAPRTVPNRKGLTSVADAARESKALYAKLLEQAASPRVISLVPEDAGVPVKTARPKATSWQRISSTPSWQLRAQEQERADARKQVQKLADFYSAQLNTLHGPARHPGRALKGASRKLAAIPDVPMLA